MLVQGLAIVAFILFLLSIPTSRIPFGFILGFYCIVIFLLCILLRIQAENDQSLSKKKKYFLLPVLVLLFPSSMLLTYGVLGSKHPKAMKDIWHLAKIGTIIFYGAVITGVIIATIISPP